MNTPNVSSLTKARNAWLADLPDWVEILARACDESSQNKVGKKLGVSGSLISQIISRKYTGVYANAEEIVRGNLMSEVVHCPAIRMPMAFRRCLENQDRLNEGSMSGAERGFFVNTCPNCPNFKQK